MHTNTDGSSAPVGVVEWPQSSKMIAPLGLTAAMAQFLKEIPPIDPDLLGRVKAYLARQALVLEPSRLYSSAVGEKFTDTSIRSSEFKALTDPEAFSLAAEVVKHVNALDTTRTYSLVRNDVTVISYKEGDFFKPHEDYLSMRSNIIEEYTLILCLSADCVGGRTIFHINEWFKYPSENSTKPGHVLVFRKDLRHEGEQLQHGTKVIMTLNLWAVERHSGCVVVTHASTGSGSAEAAAAAAAALPSGAGDGHGYILPSSRIRECGDNYFTGLLNFRGDESSDPILRTTTQFTGEQFCMIYKVIMGQYISLEQYIANQEVFDYYAIDQRYILLSDLAKTYSGGETIALSRSAGEPVLYCSNPLTSDLILRSIKEQQLPYVPFTMILAEGQLVFGGGMTGEPSISHKMVPVWFSAGELNQIWYTYTVARCRNVESCINKIWYGSLALGLAQDQEQEQDFAEVPELADDVLREHRHVNLIPFDDIDGDNDIELSESASNDGGITFSFKLGFPTISMVTMTHCSMTQPDYADLTDIVSIQALPTITSTSAWSLDDEGRLFLTIEQADRFKRTVISHDIKNHAIDFLPKLQFPQEQHIVDEYFCNESVYGKYGLYYIRGFIRITTQD